MVLVLMSACGFREKGAQVDFVGVVAASICLREVWDSGCLCGVSMRALTVEWLSLGLMYGFRGCR